MKGMTVKHLAKLCSVGQSTIRRWAETASAKMADAQNSKEPAVFSLDETIAIVRSGGNNLLADLLLENARRGEQTARVFRLPNGKQLEEMRRIFGSAEAAPRLDFIIGFSRREHYLPPAQAAAEVRKILDHPSCHTAGSYITLDVTPSRTEGNRMKNKIAVMALLTLLAGALYAEDIRVVVPYLGAATNVYQKTDPYYTIDWTDTKLMEGLYFQWINPELFQANAFFYHSADINYSQLWGGHLIADFYVLSDPLGKAAVGAGLEVISLGTHAGDVLSSQYIYDFNLPLTVFVPYARAGHYFYLGSRDKVLLSVFPWAGAEYDITRGHVSLYATPPGPPIQYVDDTIEDETLYGIAGLGVSATIMHFIELQAKYKLTFNADDQLSTWDAMANVFFTRHWGVSYRFKYMQTTSGSTSYHIGGIAYVF